MYTQQNIHNLCTHTHTHTHAIGLQELVQDLDSVATNWYSLGLQLDIDDAKLHAITSQENRAVECFRQTLTEWLKSGTATHDAVIKALRSPAIGHSVLASHLDTNGLCYSINSCKPCYIYGHKASFIHT